MPLPAVLLLLVAHVLNLYGTHCFVCTGVKLAKDAAKAQAKIEAAAEEKSEFMHQLTN